MEECINISSDSADSNHTIIADNSDISNIIKKYKEYNDKNSIVSSESQFSKPSEHLYTLDDFSDEDTILEPLKPRIKKNINRIKFSGDKSPVGDIWGESDDLSTNLNQVKKGPWPDSPQLNFSKELNKLINADIGNKCEEKAVVDLNEPNNKKIKTDFNKEAIKATKAKEREQKKIEKEQQKELKQALKAIENYIKPDKCLEFMIVNIDERLLNESYGEIIKTGLKSGNYNYKSSREIAPNLISWTRKIPTITNNLLQNISQSESHYLLVLEITEFLQHIVQNTFIGHIQSFLSLPQIKHLSVAIMGLPKYFTYLKDERNKQLQNTVAKRYKYYDFKPTRKEINLQLAEMQVFCKNVYVKLVDKYEDLVIFIIECTKAVAQIPHKAAKAETLSTENEFFYGSNKDCVKVDKDGNGLNRLWNQCLRMFPLASLETAEAISSVYPTIHSLVKAYEICKSQDDGEKLLQDIIVRRAAGPLGGSKRIGPELSRKIYRYFNSYENNIL